MTNALELRGVQKSRGTGRHATRVIADGTLSVQRGEVVLLRGPSGSGKTTLLAVAAGLLTPDAGEVWLAGERLPLRSPAARRVRARCVGFVFQRANLLAGLSAVDNVVLAAALAGMDAVAARAKAQALLDALGLAALAQRLPSELSGGEEQRVAVARALVHGPAVVLADEPTGNLDHVSGQHVAGLLAAIARERGVAVLVATHDDRLVPMGTRSVELIDGRITEGGARSVA